MSEKLRNRIEESLGVFGSQGLFANDDDYIVVSTNMVNSTYTIANQPKTACRISVLATAVDTADTMGTITIVGTDYKGNALTEVVTPIAGTTVYTTGFFKTITSITGADWVIDAVEGSNDTIKIGADYSQAITGYYFFCIVPSSDMAVSAYGEVTGTINAGISSIVSHLAGVPIYGAFNSITLASGDGIGYLAKEQGVKEV